MCSGRTSRLLAWGVAFAVFLIYLATAAPGAWWGDGQELACAAWTLGIAHPPGYPLYTLLGHGAMKTLFWLDPGRALTLFSAACLAISIGLLIPLFRRIIEDDSINPQSAIRNPQSNNPQSAILPAAGAGLLVAFASTVWEHGTLAEVLPLTFLIGVGILLLAFAPTVAPPTPWRAAALGALLGLGMLNHYSILALAPLSAFCILRWAHQSRQSHGSCKSYLTYILPALACFALMLAGYLYLPLRARANPPLNWGDPSTLARLKWMLTGGQFRDLFMGGQNAGNGVERWLNWWGALWLPQAWCEPRRGVYPLAPSLLGAVLVCLALAGHARLAITRWELGVGLIFTIFATFCYAIGYHIPDIDGYFMIGLPAAMVGWIVAIGGLARRVRVSEAARSALRALPALLALAALLGNYHAISKSWDTGPADYGDGMLKLLPENALLVTSQGARADAEIYSVWYQQMVLGKRRDVTVYGSGFIFLGWYGKYFERPERPKIPVFTEERPLSQSSLLTYNVKFFHGVLLPNLAAGRRVFTTYLDRESFLAEYLDPKPAAQLVSQAYYDACTFPFLPNPILYELHNNPRLAKMDEAQLTTEFNNFISRQTGQRAQ